MVGFQVLLFDQVNKISLSITTQSEKSHSQLSVTASVVVHMRSKLLHAIHQRLQLIMCYIS